METKLVIALHGFLGLPSDWQTWAQPLGGGVVFSALNLWDDPILNSSLSWDEWTLRFIDFVETQKKSYSTIELWGYSMGGRLALGALSLAQELFNKATIISANPGLHSTSERSTRRLRDQEWAHKFLVEEWNPLMKDWHQQPVLEEPPHVDKSVHRLEAQFNRQRLAAALVNWSIAEQPDYWPLLRDFNLPIDWHVGEFDKTYLLIGQQAQAKNPLINLIVHPQRGHRLIL